MLDSTQRRPVEKNPLAPFLNISRQYYFWVLNNLNFICLSDLHSFMSCGYLRIFDNQNIVKGLFKLYNVVIIHMSAPDTSLVITSQAATWDTCRHAQSRVEMLAVASRQLLDILPCNVFCLCIGTSIMISIMIFVSVLGILIGYGWKDSPFQPFCLKYLPLTHTIQISNMNMN